MKYKRSDVVQIGTFAAVVAIGCVMWVRLDKTAAAIQALQSDLQLDEPVEAVTLRTLKEAKSALSAVGAEDDILRTATTLADLDRWDIASGDERAFADLKLDLASQLRSRVKAQVVALQQAALSAPNGATAAAKHSEAGDALALYPMSEDRSVLEEAKQLSNQQADVAMRIEVVRRQRYNLWAANQIQYALDDYNAKQSYWSPIKENALLIDAIVTHLGPVDPFMLEPTVLELYNYIVQRTKESISEGDKMSLAKRLSDPAVRRQTLGDH